MICSSLFVLKVCQKNLEHRRKPINLIAYVLNANIYIITRNFIPNVEDLKENIFQKTYRAMKKYCFWLGLKWDARNYVMRSLLT